MLPRPESDLAEPVLAVQELCISFGDVQVLHNVSFDLRPGEIHALVGENGCGKSTFIKCLSGYYQPAPTSRLSVAGEAIELPYAPGAALRQGLSFVHQDLALVPSLSVADNLALSKGFRTSFGWRVRRRHEYRRALDALAAFDVDINPDELVESLGQAEKTLVAIARGIDTERGPQKVLVLDEPTAALPAREVDTLLAAVRQLADRGIGIIYVSHRLSEVLSIADRVTALRDGRVVATVPASELDERALVQLIIGQSLDKFYPEPLPGGQTSETVLAVRNQSGNALSNVSFDLKRGEVIGVAGLLGSGRSELGRLLFGLQKRTAGSVAIEGVEVDIASPAQARRYGLGYVPEDRVHSGGVRSMTLGENLTLSDLREFWKNGRIDKRRENQVIRSLIQRFSIRPADPDALFGSLSGGNQQKAIIARTLRLKPKVVIFDEPVQGVDIGAKTEIFSIISEVAAEGAGVIIIDSDFEDLCRLCDRILVLWGGTIVAELSGPDRTRQNISEIIQTAGALH
jgi:ribose transport system ATP-binding protein